MSVRVNLLPEATKQRDRASRQKAVLVGGLVALVVAIGAVHTTQVRSLTALEMELAAAEQQLGTLETEHAALGIYSDLDLQLTASNARLTAALSEEVSLAGLLQDIAMVTPTDTGLSNLSLVLTPSTPELPSPTVGSINLTGQTTTGHAPGVERVLLHYGKISTFQEALFNSSTIDEDGVSTFNVDIGVLPTAKTDRYADGMPEEFAR
jgi:hypothetical protein